MRILKDLDWRTGTVSRAPTTGEKQIPRYARDDTALASAKVNEHKEARSLERLDMEVSRERLDLGFLGDPRGSEAHF